MYKQLLKFKTLLLVCLLTIVGTNASWGETETITLPSGTFSTDHITWSGTSVTIQQTKGSSSTAVNSDYVSAPRVYKGHILSFEAKTGYKINSISITVDGTYYGNSMTAGTVVSNNTVTDNATDVSRTWTSTSGGTHVVSAVSDAGLSAIYIQNVASTNVQLRITSISLTYSAEAPAYTITAQSNDTSYGTVYLSGSVITGSPNSGYQYADPAYTVSPANSATVSQNGNAFTVTPSANTTVTINFEAIPTYTVTLGDDNSTLTQASAGAGVTLPSRSAISDYTFAGWSETNVTAETTTAPTIIPAGSYTPTADITLYPVYKKTVAGGGTTHESASVTISEYATANSWGSSSSANQKSITINSDVTATCNSGTNSGKYYTDWRIYQNETGKVTISTTSGELTSVTFTYTVDKTGTLNYNSSAITSGTAVEVSGTSAEFTVGNSGSVTNGQVRITAISVNYDVTDAGTTYYWSSPVAAAVERPVITVAKNPFLFSTTATITCETEGAAIKYSYDGETWNDYSSALTITETKTIYAKAVKGEDESTVASVTATKTLAEPTVTVSGDLTLDLDGETNVSAGTLTAAVTYNDAAVAGATVTWSSSDTDVATIDASTGAVTIKGTGSVTFTATYAGNSNYAEATGTKTVTVVDSNVPGASAENPYTVAQALEASASTGVYVRGIVSSIVSTSVTSSGQIRYYISDDGTEENGKLNVYNGLGLNGNKFTSIDDIQIGDVVTIYGNISVYQSANQMDANNQIVSIVTKASPELSYETTEFSVVPGDDFTAPALTNPNNLTVTYSSSNNELASVNENTGAVTLGTQEGSVTITASFAGNDTYRAGSASYTITIADPTKGTETNPYSVAEVIAGKAQGKNNVYVKGYIVGCFNNGNTQGFTTGATAFNTAANLALSDNYEESELSKVIPIQLPTDFAPRADYNLQNNPRHAHTTQIVVCGNIETYMGLKGVKSPTSMNKVGEIVRVSAAGYATFCSTAPLDFTGIEGIYAYIASVNDKNITFTRKNKIPANTGVLLRSVNGGAVSEDVPVLSGGADDVDGNVFVGATADIAALATEDGDYTNYILNNGSNGIGFYEANGQMVGAGKAYLHVNTASGVRGFISFTFNDENTGIANVEGNTQEGTTFDLQGRRVNEAKHGLYIINGKKMFIK